MCQKEIKMEIIKMAFVTENVELLEKKIDL